MDGRDRLALKLLARSARSLFDKVASFARENLESGPTKAANAAALVREASKELLEIAKEKAPVMAEAALTSARSKLGTVLPVVKANDEALPVAAE